MRIAILGWGSLIWCPRELSLKARWRRDGPSLPVEFARITKGDRVTLVLVPWDWVNPTTTYWAISAEQDLSKACENLMNREGTKPRHIHFTTLQESGTYRNETRDAKSPDITKPVQAWMAGKRVDAAVWTGLPHDGFDLVDRDGLTAQVVEYLKGLEGDARDRAEEYVRYAPPSVRTHIRTQIEQELEWKSKPLPKHLCSWRMPTARDLLERLLPRRND